MIVFNVLFKGVEKKVNPFAQAFESEEKAREWCIKFAHSRGLKICSTLGKMYSFIGKWEEEWEVDDYRLEDKEGNSYYLVIYRQELDTSKLEKYFYEM